VNSTLQWIRESAEWLFIAGGIALVFFIVFAANKIRVNKKTFAEGLGNAKPVPTKVMRLPITLETKKTASLYRVKDGNTAYLMLHVLITNDSAETILIRTIDAIMGNEKGVMVHKKFTALATHLGRKSSYSFGSTENILPLSLTAGASGDAYLCFAFPNADMEAGKVALKVAASKGGGIIPLEADVVG